MHILSGISSGPFDLLVSRPFNSFSIPGIVNVMSVIDGMELSPRSGNVPVFSCVKTLWYCLFRTSALPLLSVTSFPLLLIRGETPMFSLRLLLMNLQNFLGFDLMFSSSIPFI